MEIFAETWFGNHDWLSGYYSYQPTLLFLLEREWTLLTTSWEMLINFLSVVRLYDVMCGLRQGNSSCIRKKCTFMAKQPRFLLFSFFYFWNIFTRSLFFHFTYFYPLNIGNTKIRKESNTPNISKMKPEELMKILILFIGITIIGSSKLQLWGNTNNTSVWNKNFVKTVVVTWHCETYFSLYLQFCQKCFCLWQ